MTRIRRRILFIGEAVTLAHVTRMVTLANSVAPEDFEVVFAADPRSHWIYRDTPYSVHGLSTLPTDTFVSRLAAGKPAYDLSTLTQYVEEDLKLLTHVHPDVVVGDFRLSLSVSARQLSVPYVNIVNAYWSPFARVVHPLPDGRLFRLVGERIGEEIFNWFGPIVSRAHAAPLNRLREAHGLPRLAPDVRTVYADGDRVLYPDIPQLVPTNELPEHHKFIGPVLWEPSIELPSWWSSLEKQVPIIYLSMGSSGAGELLPHLMRTLAKLPVQVVVSTAGQSPPHDLPQNCLTAQYLPGDIVSSRSAVVVSNGGSGACYQALKHGVPVLGICSNLDQLTNMRLIATAGAGEFLRPSQTTARVLTETVSRILEKESYRHAARRFAEHMAQWDLRKVFPPVIHELLA